MYKEECNYVDTVNNYDIYWSNWRCVAVEEGRRPCDSSVEFSSEYEDEVYLWCEEN